MVRRRRPSKQARSRTGPKRAVAALGLLLAGALGTAAAQPRPLPYGGRGAGAPSVLFPAERRSLTLQQAVAIAMRRFDGRVVGAQTIIIDGRRVYEIRMIDSAGRVRTIRIDAETGQFR